MENKEQNKTLTINTILCDARQVRESTLAAYDKIAINASVLLTDQDSQELLHKYPVELNVTDTLDIPGDVQVSQINGREELGPGVPAPSRPTYLIVNGVLDIAPGAGPALERYVGIQVNGKVLCPESLSGLLASAQVNGQIETYPDDCVRLKSTVVLDRTFLLRTRKIRGTLPAAGWWPWRETSTFRSWRRRTSGSSPGSCWWRRAWRRPPSLSSASGRRSPFFPTAAPMWGTTPSWTGPLSAGTAESCISTAT